MLKAELNGASWLDLCCGSGVMGCEALQHGAHRVVAVDQDRRVLATARANLDLVAAGLTPPGHVRVVQQDILRWLRQGASACGESGFDLIYADPPYAAGLYEPLTEAVTAGGWLNAGGVLLLECASGNVPGIPSGWELIKERRYGSSTVLLLQQQAPG